MELQSIGEYTLKLAKGWRLDEIARQRLALERRLDYIERCESSAQERQALARAARRRPRKPSAKQLNALLEKFG